MKFHVVVFLCGFASIFIIPWTNGFNVETIHHTVYNEEQLSMFGFSVAEHQDRQRNGWVIVGAPEAESFQPGVTRGGAVYRCDITQDDSCKQIFFDVAGNIRNTHPSAPVEMDNKTMQWFGATVSTSQVPDGPILACAPRYMWYSANLARREPVGTCYITEHSFSGPKEFSPCRTKHWGYHRQGSCQAGLSGALSKDGQRVMIGAPGSYYWQGGVYSVDSNAAFPYMPPRMAHFGDSSGQTFSASTSNLPIVLATKEGRAKDDDSYLGYSVTTGDFEGNGQVGSAIGMPRGDNLYGKVLIFSSNLTLHHKNLTGTQLGAYFGYSIISCDVDGDGLDDIVVGAPMYTIDNPGDTFETGRVHVFYQGTGPEKFVKTETRIGFKSRSRFGLSLASLKDIDRDTFGDFAVGAPYDGPEGKGAVYIYRGSKTGVHETYSQVIYAEQVRSRISTFGFSIAGGLDLDGNEYPDMVVGAYESSTAAFFRSRPVIKIESSVNFDSQSKFITLDEKDCTLSGMVRVHCLLLNTCLSYTGHGVERSYQFNVEYALDTKKSKKPRLFFLDYETKSSINQTVTLSRDEQLCKSFKVYVNNTITDKLTSIDAEMRMSLIENTPSYFVLRDPRARLTPVLGATKSVPDTISIFKSCGSDNICIPNLTLNVSSPISKYLLASENTLDIDVIVNNTGEHAYEASFYLIKPAGIEYIKIETIDNNGIAIDCSAPSPKNNYTLLCDIGNPLPKNESVHFKVFLQPVQTTGLKAHYDLEMGVNSTNPELESTRDDNVVHFRMPIWIQTELVIEGTSKPVELYFDAGDYISDNITSEFEFGPLLTHNYTIRNDGPSALLKAEAWLIWPAQTLAGDELLYLIEQPELVGDITCGTANANYLSLKVDPKRRYQQTYRGGVSQEFSGGSNIDKTDQRADKERRKNFNEQHSSFNVSRDYDQDSMIIIPSTGSRNSSSSYFQNSSHSSSYTNEHGSSWEAEQKERQRIEYQQRESSRIRLLQQQKAAAEEKERLRIESQQRRLQNENDEAERIRLANQEKEINRIRLQQQKEAEDRENQRQEAIRRQKEKEAERIRFENRGTDVTGRFQHQEETEGSWSIDDQQREALLIRQRQRAEEAERKRTESQENERNRLLHLQRQREEEERVRENQRLEDERRRTEAIARQHLSETEQWHTERRRQDEERRRLEAERRGGNTSPNYGVNRHYITGTENTGGQRTEYEQTLGGVVTHEQEHSTGNSGLNFHSANIGSSKDLEKFFSTLNQESAAITTYTRGGKNYAQFEARFRVSDGRNYIEFRNGQVFDIQDRNGRPSYSSGSGLSDRYQNIEGQLIGSEDGKIYIELEDGRRILLPGTYTYQRTRTYTIDGGEPRTHETATGSGSGSGSRTYTYGKQLTHEGSTSEGRGFEPYESNYKEESYEQHRSGKKIISGSNAGSFETFSGSFDGDNLPVMRPDDRISRYPRESDDLNIEQFRKFERNQRHERDIGGIDFEDSVDGLSAVNRNRREEIQHYGSDNVGEGEVSSCKAAHCVRLQCTIGALKKGDEVSIKMRYRVKAKTLNKIAFNQNVKISTQLVARVTEQEFIVGTPDDQLTKSHEITTTIHPNAAPAAPDVVPLWVVVLSACAGTIILLLLIFLLYKLGFFKRNRPNSAPERQPLNKNGHYPSDD